MKGWLWAFFVVELAAQTPMTPPQYVVDPTWPKPLPNHWIVGAVVGVAVDSHDHIWVTHRPSTLQPNETRSFWKAAPPVLEFDQEGTLVSSWGGPGAGYEWPQLEHGIHVDDQDNVWLGAGGDKDAHILKFTRQGKFLLQIGRQGKGQGSNDTQNLGAAAHMVVDRPANELYVADGYVNHRVIVFDATTGAYKRHWGAYGRKPDDGIKFAARAQLIQGPPPEGFNNPVHGVLVTNDDLVYVADRTNNRLQVFRLDGTFIKEKGIERQTLNGTVFGIAFSADPEQRFAYIPDGRNEKVWILERKSLDIIGSFGCPGHFAGCMTTPHSIATDAKGNIYIGETWEGKRVQRFLYKGLRAQS
jgi:DNA-binding beta-propeller fold protein YncE